MSRHYRFSERSSCGNKKPYARWKHAENDAHMLTEKWGSPFCVYRCKFCGAVHVGSTDERRVNG